jgi:hypothetical protein
MSRSAAAQQGVVLVNIAHRDRRPRHRQAAFRLLGLFPDAAAAAEHATRLPGDADVLLAPLRRWVALLREPDEQRELPHLEELGRKHRQFRKERDEEFERNHREQRTGEVCTECPRTDGGVAGGAAGGAEPLASGPTEGVAAVPRDCELRFQNYAVISVMPDYGVPPQSAEPALLVWCVVDTEQQARDYITSELSKEVQDVHLWVTSMYEWLSPPTTEELRDVEEEYRDEKLSEIMRSKKEAPKRVAQFAKRCEEQGMDMPVIDLGNPSSSEGAPSICDISEARAEAHAEAHAKTQ